MLQSIHNSQLCSTTGGSHYLLLDEISHNLHQQGHEVRMLLQLGIPVITGIRYMYNISHSFLIFAIIQMLLYYTSSTLLLNSSQAFPMQTV